MPLIINSFRGGHTHNTHTHRRLHQNNFKKPGACRLYASMCCVKYQFKTNCILLHWKVMHLSMSPSLVDYYTFIGDLIANVTPTWGH